MIHRLTPIQLLPPYTTFAHSSAKGFYVFLKIVQSFPYIFFFSNTYQKIVFDIKVSMGGEVVAAWAQD